MLITGVQAVQQITY